MQCSSDLRTPPCQLRFRFAPSQSRAGALWKSRNDLPEECRHSSTRGLRRANFDSASLHLSRGLSPYGKAETTSRKNAGTLPQEDSAVPTSIPLRSISVAGWRPMEKQKRPAGRMRALFPKGAPPCQLRFRFASSQSRAIALWKSRNDQPEECKHSSGRSFLLFRTAQCHHESSSFPVYS